MAASTRVRFLFVVGLIIVGLLVFPRFSISQASETTSLAPVINRANQTILVEKARQQGSLRVIVTLNVPYQAEKQLAPHAATQQRAQIALAGDRLLASLAGKAYELTAKFEVFPFIALVGDAATVEAVFSSADVASVVESTLKRPSDLSSNLVIGSPAANTAGYTGAGYAVAVLDSGVQTSHPFLSGITVAEACFSRTVVADDGFTVCPNGQSTPISGAPAQTGAGSGVNCAITVSGCPHGTHVAGTAVGRNYAGGPGYNGVAPAASLIAIQVFTRFNSGCGSTPAPCIGAYDEDILGALQYVQTTLAPLHTIASINMSLGDGVNNTTTCDTSPYFTAVGSLRTLNIATVISAGNNGYSAGLSGPACVSNAISVGATQDNDTIASFSNRASFMSLFAPGVSIDSSVPNSTFDNYNGTSMAAPHVAGAWAAMRHRYSTESVAQILTRLQTTGQPITFGANTKARIKLDIGVGGPTATATTIPTATAVTAGCPINEGFSDVAGLVGAGWSRQNLSTPIGSTGWFQGSSAVFPAYSGATNSYVGADYNNVSGVGTISNWLLTPVLNLANGDTFSFWTRIPPTGTEYPDRLEMRLSTAGSSTNVGASNTSVGDFTTVLLTINPTLVTGVYPKVWTQFTATISGLATPTTGRVGFRYFVTNGGMGANSDYIGIDDAKYCSPILATATVPNTATSTAIVPTTTATSATTTTTATSTTPTVATTTAIVPTTTTTTTPTTIQSNVYLPLVIK